MAIAAAHAFACSCGMGIPGKTAWEVAKAQAQGSTAVFEGIPERIETKWILLNAKQGELIRADLIDETLDNGPRMVVTFRVQRAYKGDLGPEVQISTGFGGGDCGAVFVPGLNYLVYAGGPNLHELSTGLCSPGGWIGSSEIQVDLRFLRNERPTPTDLAPYRRWTVEESVGQKKLRERNFEEFERRYAAVTGRICGAVIPQDTMDTYPGTVSFLSTSGYSPVEHPTAEVKQDGTFCSGRLGPGKYYLHFIKVSDEGMTSAIYYPGVNDRMKATAIELTAGQTQTDIIFKVPMQKTYSVRGFISTNDTLELPAEGVSVFLFSLDAPSQLACYTQTVDFYGRFPLPKVKYFNFENVLPGRYIAYVSVLGPDWFTRKSEVTVDTHVKFISLELVHNIR